MIHWCTYFLWNKFTQGSWLPSVLLKTKVIPNTFFYILQVIFLNIKSHFSWEIIHIPSSSAVSQQWPLQFSQPSRCLVRPVDSVPSWHTNILSTLTICWLESSRSFMKSKDIWWFLSSLKMKFWMSVGKSEFFFMAWLFFKFF